MKLPRYVRPNTDVSPYTVLKWARIDVRRLNNTDACKLLSAALIKALGTVGEKPYDDDKTYIRTLRLVPPMLVRWYRLAAHQRPLRRARRWQRRVILDYLRHEPVELLDFIEHATESWRCRRMLEREIGPTWRGHVRSLESPE